MRDYAREPYERLARDAPEVPVSVEYRITLHPNRSLTFEGPLDDAHFCMWLLDEAEHAIKRRACVGLVTPTVPVDTPEATAARLHRVSLDVVEPVTMRIRLHVGGAMSIVGPVDDGPLCRAMIAQARDVMRRRKASTLHRAVEIVQPEDVGLDDRGLANLAPTVG